MGCRLSRSESDTELENALNVCNEQSRAQQHTDNHKTAKNPLSNGQSANPSGCEPDSSLSQKMSPQPARPTISGEKSPSTTVMCTKPIGQVESASQADFFKMLDEKIAHVSGGIFTVINYIYANGY
uniref:Uncharacterized protein n=1 Tax=Parascaris univalens TaxID=6257 RepID=A0A915AI26_PARUN